MHRTRIATAVLLAATTAGTVALTANASKSNSPPCTPKIATIGGHKAAVNCGPATATLRIGGKSYTFRNGFCEHSKSTGAAPELNLGTTVIGVKGNAGKADLSMLIDARLHSPFGSGSVFHADYGGRQILGQPDQGQSDTSPPRAHSPARPRLAPSSRAPGTAMDSSGNDRDCRGSRRRTGDGRLG